MRSFNYIALPSEPAGLSPSVDFLRQRGTRGIREFSNGITHDLRAKVGGSLGRKVTQPELILEITYPALDQGSRTQTMALDSKQVPQGVKAELLKRYSAGNPSELNIEGFNYKLRPPQPADYIVSMVSGNTEQALQALPKHLSLRMLPTKKPNDLLSSIKLFKDAEGSSYYKMLNPKLYPQATLANLDFENKVGMAYNRVIEALNEQGLANASIELNDLGIVFQFKHEDDKIKASVLAGDKVLNENSVIAAQIQTSPNDNGVTAFIEAEIKKALAKTNRTDTGLPDFVAADSSDYQSDLRNLHQWAA